MTQGPWGADRIDYGVRAIEDPEFVALLVDRRIPLGVCPTSNLELGVYARVEEHPIDRLRRAGVVVSINTDDPVLLGASLEGEYALCSQAFAWSDDDLRAPGAQLDRRELYRCRRQGESARGFGALVKPVGCEPWDAWARVPPRCWHA